MSYITAIGTANPAYKLRQTKIVERITNLVTLTAAERRLLKNIYRLSGIDYRYSVFDGLNQEVGLLPTKNNQNILTTSERMKIYKDHALNLALSAVNDCFLQVEEKKEITHVITVSCTGMYAPGLEIELIQHLELNSHVQRYAINFMGCYGVFNALKIAHSICQSNPQAIILIVSVELCTLHFQPQMSRDNIISNAIFSDGAAAAVIKAKSSNLNKLQIKEFHCDLYSHATEHMTWKIGDSGFDIVLSSYVPQLIENGIHKLSEGLLRKLNLSLSNMDHFAVHPGGIAVLKACEEALAIKYNQIEASYDVLKNFGNMSSATILFVLKKLLLTIKLPKKNIFSCAFGPGLTLESMLLET